MAVIRSATPGGQLVDRAGTVDRGHAGRHVLPLDLPAGGDRLGDEHRALDDERAFLGTRTAAPVQAPQPLDLGLVEPERVGHSLRARLGRLDEGAEGAGS